MIGRDRTPFNATEKPMEVMELLLLSDPVHRRTIFLASRGITCVASETQFSGKKAHLPT